MAYSGGTIVNPTIPYNCPIPGGLPNGKMIIVQGTCHHHHNNFAINLCVSPQISPLPDTALHFNVRFNENAIIRNSQQYNAWGQEERGGGMPLRKGTPFEIIILADPHHYKISINGRHYTNFRHRIPKESVQYLIISGDVNISYIKFEGGASPAPPAYAGAQPIYNPPVPFTTNIPGGIYPGRMLYVSGIPNPNVSRFTVNLMCGPSEQGDIGLHFDVRFNYGGAYNQTIRTHKVGSTWGTEEKHQNFFPFVPNANFDMIILIEQASIKIAVNNQHFCEFNHRIQPLNRIDYLNVNGDVRLTSVKIQ
ncbi:galectin-4-like isoform X2 [Haliotis cracherodii]|uniref:galectin-4-like isoform X3 n=1 Tax=Haliotis rufescens TaxID=6454 RepID=UPI001EB08C42|nr:galectin-4-like isoform X3 [Haliotis rufescens]